MINVVLKGHLGNNLFQYAVGKHLAIKNKTTLRLITHRHVNRHNILGRKTIKPLSAFKMEPVSYAAMIHEEILRRLGIPWSFYGGKVYRERGWGFRVGGGVKVRRAAEWAVAE